MKMLAPGKMPVNTAFRDYFMKFRFQTSDMQMTADGELSAFTGAA